jgi:hypothetical protein
MPRCGGIDIFDARTRNAQLSVFEQRLDAAVVAREVLSIDEQTEALIKAQAAHVRVFLLVSE